MYVKCIKFFMYVLTGSKILLLEVCARENNQVCVPEVHPSVLLTASFRTM